MTFAARIITMTFLGGLASTVFIPLSAWLIHALGWRHALWVLAAIQLLVCVPVHARWLRDAPRRAAPRHGSSAAQPGLAHHLRSTPFLLMGVFVVIMMAVTAALPAHMVSLLRENGLSEVWVVAIPASIGIIQVLGRLLLYVFEQPLRRASGQPAHPVPDPAGAGCRCWPVVAMAWRRWCLWCCMAWATAC
jgi:predicted MFS family arabinose efflux permease